MKLAGAKTRFDQDDDPLFSTEDCGIDAKSDDYLTNCYERVALELKQRAANIMSRQILNLGQIAISLRSESLPSIFALR